MAVGGWGESWEASQRRQRLVNAWREEPTVSRWTGVGGAPSPPRRPSWILQAGGWGGVGRGLMVSEQ